MNRQKQSRNFKRRQEGRTDYRKRLSLLKSRKLRLVVRKSLKNIRVQLAEYAPAGDKIIATAFSTELKKLGWGFSCSNIPAAYLTGLLCGVRAVKTGKKEAVLDLGLDEPTKNCKLYSALKGAVDAGMDIPHSKEILPTEDKIKGAHISAYATLLKKNKSGSAHQFSAYAKNRQEPENIQKSFEQIKIKIIGSKA